MERVQNERGIIQRRRLGRRIKYNDLRDPLDAYVDVVDNNLALLNTTQCQNIKTQFNIYIQTIKYQSFFSLCKSVSEER